MKYILFVLASMTSVAAASDLVPHFLSTPEQIQDVTAAYLRGERPKFGTVTPALPIYNGVIRGFEAAHPPELTEALVASLGRLTAFGLRHSAIESARRGQPWSKSARPYLLSMGMSADLSMLITHEYGRPLPRGLYILDRIAKDGKTPQLRRAARNAIEWSIDALTDVALARGPLALSRRFPAQEKTAVDLIHALGGGRNVDLLWFSLSSDQAVGAALRSYLMHERPLGSRADDNPARRIFDFVVEHAVSVDDAARASELLPTLSVLIKCAIRNEVRGLVTHDGPRDLQFLIAEGRPGVLPGPLKAVADLAAGAPDPVVRLRAEMLVMDLVTYVVEMIAEVPARTDWLRTATDLLSATGSADAVRILDGLTRAQNPELARAARETSTHACAADLGPIPTDPVL